MPPSVERTMEVPEWLPEIHGRDSEKKHWSSPVASSRIIASQFGP